MSSYETIFRRHNPRPLSYLDSHLDSPITRVPTPFFVRSPSLVYQEKRRPTSISSVEDVSRYYSNSYKYASTIDSPRDVAVGHKQYLRDITPRYVTESYRYSPPPKVSSSKYLSDFATKHDTKKIPSSKIFNEYPKAVPKSRPSKVFNEYPKVAPKDSASKIFNEHPKVVLQDSTSKILNRHRHPTATPTEDTKSRNFCDNYRHAVTFPDSHLSRRELPLCTPDELLDIIREPSGYYALPTDPWNEVYPDIYLSDAPTALCTAVLKRIGVTHVLNAAQGREKGCGQVNTTQGFYSDSGIQFLGVPAFDNIVFRIYPYFEQAAQFVEDGLKSKGKVLVHCRAGISRSATLVCAFLMLKRGMTVQEAVKTVRKNRAIIPNDGFLQQLCDLNDRLKQRIKTR